MSEGQRQGDGGALVQAGAGGGGVSTMLTGDAADQEESEASAFDTQHGAAGDSIEAAEDALVLVGRQSKAGVRDVKSGPGVARDCERATDVNAFGRVFDCVVEKIEDGGADVFGDAENSQANTAGNRVERDGIRGKVVALEGDGDGIGDEGLEVDEGTVLLALALTQLAGFKYLLDGGEEAVGVGEHDFVELLTLGLVDVAALESLEVEPHGGDGCFEFVSDGVEEGVLTLVPANLADEKDGVEHDSGDEHGEEDDAQDREGDGALVEDDPADIEGDGEADKDDAEGNEECDGSAPASDVHGSLWGSIAVASRAERDKSWTRQELNQDACNSQLAISRAVSRVGFD